VLIAGIDPGLDGAIVAYDADAGTLLAPWDMPTYSKLVARRERRRLDLVEIDKVIETLVLIGVDVVWIEDVAGRGNQVGGGQLSYGVGVLHAFCVARRLRYEVISPGAWKARLRAPAGKEGATQRAEALFPKQRALFRGPKGGKMDGRAEAAMIAFYGAMRK